MSTTKVSGHILAISHIFYLSGKSKSFFIHVLTEAKSHRFILVPLKGRTREWKPLILQMQQNSHVFIGRFLSLENVTKRIISINEGRASAKVFVILEETLIEIKGQDHEQKDSQFLNFDEKCRSSPHAF